MTSPTTPVDGASPEPLGEFEDLGPNSGLVEEIYRRFRDDPGSVAESWRDFFSDYRPRAPLPGDAAPNASPNGGDGASAAVETPPAPAPAPAPRPCTRARPRTGGGPCPARTARRRR